MAIEDSPAFKEAVAKAVASATAEIFAKMQAAGPAKSGDESFARDLALEIARISDQGTNRKRVPPQEMMKREAAQERMEDLLIAYRAKGVVPQYELLKEVYLEERLVKATYVGTDHVQRKTQIGWPGVPNEHMRPINESAGEVFTAYIEYIGGPTSGVSHAAGKRPTVKNALKVMHEPEGADIPHVGKPRQGELQILGRHQPNEVIETNVLGTVARPARQNA